MCSLCLCLCLWLEFQVFRTQSFYFGQDYEITHSAQRIAELRASDPSVTGPETWRRADDRFLWNAQFLTEFAKARDELHGVDEWITPVMCGYVWCAGCSGGFVHLYKSIKVCMYVLFLCCCFFGGLWVGCMLCCLV